MQQPEKKKAVPFQIPKRQPAPGVEPSSARPGSAPAVRPGSALGATGRPPLVGASAGALVSSNRLWCLDNVPEWVTTHTLLDALKKEVSGLVMVDVPVVQLDIGMSHPGYAVLCFATPAAAEIAEPVLRQLCVQSRTCDIPRPLIPRRPWLKKDYPWGRHPQLPGHLPIDQSVTPHFVQPSSIEFELAMDWRVLEKAASIARGRVHAEHAGEIANAFLTYLREKGKQSPAIADAALQIPPPRGATAPSACLWLQGVSGNLTINAIKEAFAQFGYPQKVDILRDKVTGQVNGSAIVRMESAERAFHVAQNMQDMVFVLGGSPRPLAVEVAEAGGPRGSQSTYDRALCGVFGQYDDGPAGHAAGASVEFVKVPVEPPVDAPLEHRVAVYLRAVLENHRLEQDEARQVVREARSKLAEEQLGVYKSESTKLQRLKELRDGPLFEKMCDLHGLQFRKYRHRGAAPLRQP